MVALVFKNIPAATRIRTKYLRDQVSYDDIFTPDLPMAVWPNLVSIYKTVDSTLVALVASLPRRERLIGNLRPLISLLVVARLFNTFAYSPMQLAALDPERIDATNVREAFDSVLSLGMTRFGGKKVTAATVVAACSVFGDKLGISGIETVGKRQIRRGYWRSGRTISAEFVNSVDAALPKQPWKPGVHAIVAQTLKSSPRDVSDAIQLLIESGRRNEQRDGVVYNSDGAVIAVDPERVRTPPPTTF